MRLLLGVGLLFLTVFGLSTAASTAQLEASKFIGNASARYYKLYDQIAEETYASTDDEDFDAIFSKLNNVQRIAKELVEISESASDFDLSKMQDPVVKSALQSLRKVGDLFVLGDDYFSSVLINIGALKSLATDKDIEPYLGGANMPDQDDSMLAYFPDIQKIYRHSNDSDELKYYWETFREKNLVWSSINFYTIVEAFQKAAKILEIPVLDFWYRYYNNKDFLLEMEKVMQELKPVYKELHAFVRHQLYQKYGGKALDVHGPIPDHLFHQVLQQAWFESSVIEEYFPHKELPPYDSFVEEYDAKKMIDETERFYQSLGFGALGEEFWQEQLKEHDESSNSGDCRAAIFDLTPHVLMKYCKEVDFRKFMQTHGYLARVHYAQEKHKLPAYFFNSYDLEYPVGEAVILSASTPKHLAAIGLAKKFQFTDNTLMNRLFRMGIHTILNIPLFFVHTKLMNDLLDGSIEMDGVNKHYWKLMAEYAGVEPPTDRAEGAIDFPYSFYMDMEENHQTKKFVSEVLGYQLYRAFCKKTSQASPLHNCDFYGNVAIGNDLKSMMALGSSKPWREVIAKLLPNNEGLSADAMLEYYKPILDWVKNKNTDMKLKVGWSASKKKVL